MTSIERYPLGVFCWFDLFTPDLASSRQFYNTALGWQSEEQPSGRGAYTKFLADGETVAGGGEMSADMLAGGTPPSWQVYVHVAELEPVLEEAVALGASVIFDPQDRGEAGRLAYLADPEGVVFALWQPRRDHGARRRNTNSSVSWVELASRDIDAASSFYGELFGWTPSTHPQMPNADYRVLHSDGEPIGGMLRMTDEWGDMPAHWSLYIETFDIAAAVERVGAAGGDVAFGPFESPAGQIAVCTDNVGASFYLIQLAAALRATGRGMAAGL